MAERGGVGGEQDLLIALEIEQLFGGRRFCQGPVAAGIGDDFRRVGTIEQRRKARHDRIGRQHARIPEMGQMPCVAVFQSDPRQVRSDAARGKHVWQVVGVFAGLGHRPPAARFAGDRAHVLGVAIPAAFPRIDCAPAKLQGRVVARPVLHPFQLAQIGAHHLGDLVGARLGLQHRQHALHESGERDTEKAAPQGIKAQSVTVRTHGATPPKARPPAAVWAAPRGTVPDSTLRIRL